jgi:hypothetical protein
VPVFVEFGTELLRFFDVDGAKLEAIVNDGVEPSKRVDRDDIALLALTGAQQPYAALKLSELNQQDSPAEQGDLSSSLRQYLYDKYVYRNGSEARTPEPILVAVAGGTHD